MDQALQNTSVQQRELNKTFYDFFCMKKNCFVTFLVYQHGSDPLKHFFLGRGLHLGNPRVIWVPSLTLRVIWVPSLTFGGPYTLGGPIKYQIKHRRVVIFRFIFLQILLLKHHFSNKLGSPFCKIFSCATNLGGGAVRGHSQSTYA